MSEDTDAGSPQAVKLAQQHSVLRFLGLYRLLGGALRLQVSAVEHAPTVDTPLSLLRGLGQKVGIEAPDIAVAQAIGAIYGLAPSSEAPLDEADLVIVNDGEGVGRALDAMKHGALLVVSLQLGSSAGSMAASLATLAALTERLCARFDIGEAVFKSIYRHRLLMLRKCLPGGGDGSIRRVRRKILRQLATASAASRIPLAAKLFSLAAITAAHPQGRQQASYKLWATRQARRLSREADRLAQDPMAIVHFGVHAAANAGDRVLFEAVRAAIDPKDHVRWALRNVRDPVTSKTIDAVNASRGIVIGGGGLFLVDLDSASASGWQWPCPPSLLDRIDVPLIVFAVGYNRFRGQREFPSAFVDSLTRLVERADFIGIRNHGSIRALREYLPGKLADKLMFQPCPTTVMRYLDLPGARETIPSADGRRLVINTAFDRYAMRMAGREEQTLGGIARMARVASAQGWRVTIACHLFDDEAIRPFMDQAGVPYDVRYFTGSTTEDILRFYRSVDLVVGMRGHAQMIPFGVGTPIISLVAHDKMGWFLDDIGHPEWGIDFTDVQFEEKLLAAFEAAASNLPGMRYAVDIARKDLWRITRSNLETVRAALKAEM